jgi:Xaa-Pro aminopeptidase
MSELANTERLRRLMAEAGIDAVIATSKRNACYLGASWGGAQDFPMQLYSGGAPDKRFGIFTAEGEIHVSGAPDRSRWDQITQPILEFMRSRRLDKAVIAVEFDHMPVEDFKAIREGLPGARIVNGTRLLLETRMVKTDGEIELIRQAVDIASRAHRSALAVAGPGVTMGDIVDTMHAVYSKEGAQSLGRFQLVDTLLFRQENGEGGRYRIHSGFQRETSLQPGDHLSIDSFPQYEHYLADMARFWSVGEPSAQIVQMHRATTDIQKAVLDRTGPGVSTSDIQKAILGAIDESGQYEQVGWRTGHIHGIGLDVHEPPFAGGGKHITEPIPFFSHYDLEPGMVFAVECAAKAPDRTGHCLMECVVLVTEDGYDLLDTVGRELHVV